MLTRSQALSTSNNMNSQAMTEMMARFSIPEYVTKYINEPGYYTNPTLGAPSNVHIIRR